MKRKSAKVPLVAVLFSAVCIPADEPGPVASIPMRLNEAHQCRIEVRINGSDPITCGVDSGGGDRIYLDRDRAAKMGIQATGTGSSAGPQDTKMKQDSRGKVTLEVGGVTFADQTVVLQSRPYAEYSCGIGQTVFRQYIVEVDYEAPAIRLYNPERFHYGGPGKVVPITLDGGSPFVTATLTMPNGDSLQARLAVDTGCGLGLVMLSKAYVDKNNLMAQKLTPTPDNRYGFAGEQPKVVSAQIEKFSVGPFDVPRPVVHLWQVPGFGGSGVPDGLLCGDFLRRFKLIFDYGRKTMILEPNAHCRE